MAQSAKKVMKTHVQVVLALLGRPKHVLAGKIQRARDGVAHGFPVARPARAKTEDSLGHGAQRATGLRPANLDWLYAYNLFRLAAICQGIAGRVRDGTAASAHARTMAAQVGPLSDAAWSFARKAGA